MSHSFSMPSGLSQLEFVRGTFHLQLEEDVDLPCVALLQLRRELMGVLKGDDERSRSLDIHGLKELLSPPLPYDQLLLHQVQKPPSALVLSPPLLPRQGYAQGQLVAIPFLLLGQNTSFLGDLGGLFSALGRRGLYNGQGLFELHSIDVEDSQQQSHPLWRNTDDGFELSPTISDLAWWLDSQPLVANSVRLQWKTPLRLVKKGKPLFKVDFERLFPFLLRRVTSMLSFYGGIDLSDSAAELCQAAKNLHCRESRLTWKDWRTLDGGQKGKNLGGLLGDMVVEGEALEDFLWILQLGTLFNLGKGAAYGSGCYALTSSTEFCVL